MQRCSSGLGKRPPRSPSKGAIQPTGPRPPLLIPRESLIQSTTSPATANAVTGIMSISMLNRFLLQVQKNLSNVRRLAQSSDRSIFGPLNLIFDSHPQTMPFHTVLDPGINREIVAVTYWRD